MGRSNSLSTGFGLSLGCLLGVAAFLVGGIVLVVALVGGAIHLGNEARERQQESRPQPSAPAKP